LFRSHFAMDLAATPLAFVKEPAAYRPLPDAVNDCTENPLVQSSSADQLLPFHLAMFVAATPPAVVNLPPAYSSPSETASQDTRVRLGPLIPDPSADQLVPSHFAI